MQNQPIGWDPIVTDRFIVPLPTRLLMLYLFVVGATAIARFVGMVRQLWSSKSPRRAWTSEAESTSTSHRCADHSQSLKRLVVLTLLLTALGAIAVAQSDLILIVEQKAYVGVVVVSAIREMLQPLELGILASTLLYAACALYEGGPGEKIESEVGGREEVGLECELIEAHPTKSMVGGASCRKVEASSYPRPG